jgi:hypothetical protein
VDRSIRQSICSRARLDEAGTVTRKAAIAVKGTAITLLVLILWTTNDLFLMVGGSDSTSFLIAPTVPVQIVCLAVFAAAVLVPASGPLRLVLVMTALGAALLGGHRLVIDNLHNEIRDVYLAVAVQSLALDPAHEGGLSMTPSGAGMRIGQAGTGRALWCFSPGPIGLDPASLSNLAQ